MRFLIARSLLASAALALGSATAQTTIRVPADWPTMQEAIVAAVDGDTVLVAPGTYFEELYYFGKAITLVSEGGPEVTTLVHWNSAVNFENGEGPDSILRGFNVTTAGGSRPAIYCQASPRIQHCTFRNIQVANYQPSAIWGGGPTVEDCLFESNVGPTILGSPTLRRCTFRGNYGYDAAAMRLWGGYVEDCVIVNNWNGEGSGGTVLIESSTPVTLVRCLFAGNTNYTNNGQYSSLGAALTVGPIPAILVNCTIVGNTFDVPNLYGYTDNGGIYGSAVLVNCVVRDNAGEQFQAANTTALHSNIEGGLAGVGNIDADPLFRDALNGDYHLLPGSPCIDAGSPSSPLDFDESRADMGALAFTHALAAPRNGAGVNLPLLTSASIPTLGSHLLLTIHAALVPQPVASGITIKQRALTPGVMTPFGELLAGGPTLGHVQQLSNGVADDFGFFIPPSLALIGFEGFAQGYVIRQGTPFDVELGNALRLLIGQ